MKLCRYGEPGHEKPALIASDGSLRDLSGVVADIDGDALAPARLAELARLDPGTLRRIEGRPRLGPCVAWPGRMICIGLNYVDHAAESGLQPPAEPVVFGKLCAWSGPNDPIPIPKDSRKTDWEVELGVVIGREARHVAEPDALAHVAGYCIVHDVSEREFQIERGGQWVKGKSCDGFAPVGPWLVTADEVGDPGRLRLWCEVNGRRFQDGNTRNLIFAVPFIVSYLSRFFTLRPGDVIATGTPAGVGLGQKPEPIYLKAGDVVRLGIDGLGEQEQRCVAYGET